MHHVKIYKVPLSFFFVDSIEYRVEIKVSRKWSRLLSRGSIKWGLLTLFMREWWWREGEIDSNWFFFCDWLLVQTWNFLTLVLNLICTFREYFMKIWSVLVFLQQLYHVKHLTFYRRYWYFRQKLLLLLILTSANVKNHVKNDM